MIRLHVVAEGQTEETFVQRVLVPHLGDSNIVTDVHCVTTSRHRGRPYRGGLVSYAHARRDIELWLKQDRNDDARFTTMFDTYRLPQTFPRYREASDIADAYRKVEFLEEAMAGDIRDRRFIPYLQLHEFEALLLARPAELGREFLDHEEAIRKLAALSESYDSPELINDDLPPSKRIARELPAYEGRKTSVGPLVAERVGLPDLREVCPHFDQWLERLERLADS